MSTFTLPSSSASQGPDGPREWETLFHSPVEEDDPIWKDYIKAANAFDNRMIEEWNKVINVVLVYVALFISILTAFAVGTAEKFERDPADISNQLLLGIYKNQLAFLQNGTVVYNSLLFSDLALSIVVSMIALFAKLWVISYSHQANSSGSPYQRAIKRQEAYSGVLAWRLKPIIDSLPFLLLIAVFMLGIFIYQSIRTQQSTIGYVVGAMLLLGLAFLILASVAAAFIPGCPFDSSLTTLVKLLFKLFPGYTTKLSEKVVGSKFSKEMPGLLQIISVTLASAAVLAVMVYCVLHYSGAYYALVCFPFAASVSIFGGRPKSDERPPKYGIQHWILFASSIIAPFIIAASYFSDTRLHTFVGLFSATVALLVAFTIGGVLLFKTMPNTGEIDAMSWLLEWSSSQEPSYFQKAAQISKPPKDAKKAPEEYVHRKSSLLKPLQPLLASLITSKIQYWDSERDDPKDQALQLKEEETKDLEIYVACLAQLSAFTDSQSSWRKNRSAVIHPKQVPDGLVESLEAIDKMLEAESYSLLRSAAQDALQHYKAKDKTKGQEAV
ncbi:hypothetical protein M413DRAFT_29830 [Hebeloma cylindrosporum]|uniref:DUF6535 domain-containing protein n=1 Tax=Hebeloma cylindrosporum TaxID=76867 RepID=A0A0C2YCZ3_HEBCY|nr:hypothetical protein M413DRAFT_29830 [Hebeloma cylindrosporum h7]